MATTGVNAMPVVDRSTNVICGQGTLQIFWRADDDQCSESRVA